MTLTELAFEVKNLAGVHRHVGNEDYAALLDDSASRLAALDALMPRAIMAAPITNEHAPDAACLVCGGWPDHDGNCWLRDLLLLRDGERREP